jgi:hypothetical protein
MIFSCRFQDTDYPRQKAKIAHRSLRRFFPVYTDLQSSPAERPLKPFDSSEGFGAARPD